MGLILGLILGPILAQEWTYDTALQQRPLPQVAPRAPRECVEVPSGVPHDLRELIGKTAWVRYIGDVARPAAEIVAHTEDAKNGALIKQLRTLSPEDRAQIASIGGIEKFKLYAAVADNGIPYLQAVAKLELPSDDDADDDPDSSPAQSALIILQAQQSVARVRAEAQKARHVAAKLAGNTEGAALMSLVDLWNKVKRPRSEKAVEKTQLYVRRFVEIVGDLEPERVTRGDVIKFRDGLEKRGYTSSNITQHLDKLHTLFNVALSEGKVDANPAYKIKARKDGGKLSDGRQGFTTEHIRKMLAKLKGEREDFAWIVRLLVYHGARSGEICQLRCDDVTTLHGVAVLRIHDRHGRVKNKASVRDIPIHPKCKKIIAYAKHVAVKQGADAWLFPDLPLQKQGRAHWFQNYKSRLFVRETCGIEERCYTMHSLRHTWRTLAREIDMPESVSRSLMGHSLGKDDHAGYGGVPSLKTRAEWMAKIDPLAVE